MKPSKTSITAGMLLLLAAVSSGQTATPSNAAVVADAQNRTWNGGQNAGHDEGGFFIAGEGFRLNIGGDYQFRYTANFNRDGGDDEHGFSVPLARIRFTGTIYDNVDFSVEGGFNRDGGDFDLKDAYVGVGVFANGNLRFGQFKVPFLREESMSERFQLAADRSIVTYVFGQGRSQGTQLTYDAGNLRLMTAFSDGFKTANTEFDDPREADYALTGRVEYMFAGTRNDFRDFTSVSGQSLAVLAGGSVHYQDSDLDGTLFTYTADLSFKNAGWNAFVSGVGRNIDDDSETYNDYGVVAQCGYRVTETIEPFARYDAIFADSDRGFSNDTFNFVTAGFNYYLHGQAAKFTLDGIYAFDRTDDLATLANFDNTGLFPSSGDGEVVVRFQFQLLF